jgi:membrane-bound inhibitor of C-type lysozyme
MATVRLIVNNLGLRNNNMLHRSILTISLMVGLAACNRSPAEQEATASGPAVQSASSMEKASYSCENGMKILAEYANGSDDKSTAKLEISGNSYMLVSAISASGARYTTMNGMKPDKALEWWTKGDRGTLSDGPKNEDKLLEESVILTQCKEG